MDKDRQLLIDAGIILPVTKERRWEKAVIAEAGKAITVLERQEPVAAAWPEPIAAEAFHGLAGEIVRAIEPHTEADPAALLFSFFVMFGNIIDRSAHFVAEADRHYMNLFACMVGTTSKGRKGVSFGQISRLFSDIDPGFLLNRVTPGLSSGEGLVWAVRDPQKKIETNKETGEEREIIVDGGVLDKRLLAVESEFASALRVLRRDGNTLSAVVRQAWDTGRLNFLTKNAPAQATGAHVSIIGHITKDELLRYLDATESGNGFGNRFLWVCVRRSKCLPEGGRLHEVDFAPLRQRLAAAVDFARTAGQLERNRDARELWAAVYPELSEGKPGLLGAMIARAEAQVMRLACVYALLDMSRAVRVEHLQAALGCWDYAEASARFIFGEALGDPAADEILRTLKAAPEGLTRTEVSGLFGRNLDAGQLGRALSLLVENGLAYSLKEPGIGRPVERWFYANALTK